MGAGLDLVTGRRLAGERDRLFLGRAGAWAAFARWLTG
jgi:hypothetical protein